MIAITVSNSVSVNARRGLAGVKPAADRQGNKEGLMGECPGYVEGWPVIFKKSTLNNIYQLALSGFLNRVLDCNLFF
jgi:hypothetical protein